MMNFANKSRHSERFYVHTGSLIQCFLKYRLALFVFLWVASPFRCPGQVGGRRKQKQGFFQKAGRVGRISAICPHISEDCSISNGLAVEEVALAVVEDDEAAGVLLEAGACPVLEAMGGRDKLVDGLVAAV